MTVPVKGLSLIVRREAIETRLIGGLPAFSALIENQTSKLSVDDDGQLVSVALANPYAANLLIADLERQGLLYIRRGTAADMAVCDPLVGLYVGCDWLDLGYETRSARLAELPGRVMGRTVTAKISMSGLSENLPPDSTASNHQSRLLRDESIPEAIPLAGSRQSVRSYH